MNESHQLPVRFYFALPRLLASLRGGDPTRAEQNGTEAWAAGIAIYVISYLFFAGFVSVTLVWWLKALVFIGLAFAGWIFWLLVLYINSLILALLRVAGLFASVPARRGQSALVGTAATAMAFELLRRGALVGELGAIFLIAVAMNLAATMILALRDGHNIRS